LNVGFLHGARLDKTLNYDVVKDGYAFKAPFTPITFVKLCDLGQPLHHAGETYYFGFSPQEMQRVAALTKKDLEDALAVEQNRINTTRKKLQAAWVNLTAQVVTEMQAVERAGGDQPIPKTTQAASNTTPAVLPSPTQEEETKPDPSAPVLAAQTPPEKPATTPASTKSPAKETAPPADSNPPVSDTNPVTGEIPRVVNAFDIYVAYSKAEAAKTEGSLSVGYCAQIKNQQTGEVTEIGKSGYTREFEKMIVLALCEAFEQGVIPPSTKTAQTLTTIYTTNELVESMFAKGYLRRYSNNGWKKKDGGDISFKAEWMRIWNHASHMFTSGVLCVD
jgi:hypothetical protein